MYDVLIIGGSCAGLSAAMTARKRNLSVLVLYAGDGAMGKVTQMDNYPGLPGVSGESLLHLFRKQAADLGAELKKQLVQRILPMGRSFSVLAQNDLYEAKSIILALGTARVNLLAGEEELLGQGVGNLVSVWRNGFERNCQAHQKIVRALNDQPLFFH